jgi:cellulose synthase/poly-beta-1,6-N-acetylglucosamine synthase-like glycosyltransferase
LRTRAFADRETSRPAPDGGDGSYPRAGSREPPEISVVIPAYRAEQTIDVCLASLEGQHAPPRFEVIVVDSSPDEETARAARAHGRQAGGALDLTVVHLGARAYAGPARNLGADRARASRLLFLDADCRADADLLRGAVDSLAQDPGVAGAAIAQGGPRAVSARVRHLLEFKEALPGVPPRRTWQLPSACLACDRAVFARHGGFPSERAAEDWRLNWRMWRAGESLRFDPRLKVAHFTPSGWRALARYCAILGRASGAARKEEGLPGQAVVRWPLLAFALPFGRTFRALVWCARHDRRELGFLLFAWPAYLVMCGVWAAGFYRGVRGEAAE